MIRRSAIFFVFAASTMPAALRAAPCTQETLHVEGSPVTVEYCIDGALRTGGSEEIIVPVTATYSAPGGTLQRSTQLHFMAGEGISRVLESLDLARVGLTGTLHLTLAYSRGLVLLEGALLTPGAITIK
jgi:hypothetical protein